MLGLLLTCSLIWAVVDARPIVVSVHKHHAVHGHTKLNPLRWVVRSNERRRERGLAATPLNLWRRRSTAVNAKARQHPSLPTGGDVWPVAIYWAFLTIGTPSAQYPAAIDSGSFTLDIPLKGCNGCVNTPPNHAYDPSASSSSHLFTCSLFKSCTPGGAGCSHDECTFSNTYETCVPTNPTEPCTISGLWYSDKVTWGNSGAVTVQFGAINYQTSNFEQFQNINAVVGMAGPSNPESVIGQLASNNAIDSYVWSICLQPGAISNGTITIGGIDSRLHNGPVVYTPNTGGGQFYQMQANGLTVGNSQVYLDESQVIIDSGTNILLLPTESYTSMKQQMLAMCSSVNLHGICDVPSTKTLFDNYCYSFTPSQVAAFPNITLAVPNINLVMRGRDYILLNYGVNYQPGQSCLGISPTGEQGLFIVGDTLLWNYLTVFDQANQRIGWSPVSNQCGNIKA